MKSEESLHGTPGFLKVRELHRHFSVDPMDDMVALGQHRIFVPFGNVYVHGVMLRRAPFHSGGIHDDALPVLGHDSASAFLVQHRAIRPVRMNVALVAADRPLPVLVLVAAVLNAGVVAALFDCRL